MADLLANVVKDPDGGLYSARVLGSQGQDCTLENNLLFNTCLFRSDDQSINDKMIKNNGYGYWNNAIYVVGIDLGFERGGWVLHQNLSWIYLAPIIYSNLETVGIWFYFLSKNVDPIGDFGWTYFQRSNILRHWAFEPQYINNPSALGTFSEGYGLFLWRDAGVNSGYHAFIINENGNIFVSEKLKNLGDGPVSSIQYYSF